MNKHSIDRLFKKKLSGHELPHPEHLWSSIDQRINDLPQDKRRGGLWISWMGLGLFLLLAGSLGYMWMNSETSSILQGDKQQLSVNESVALGSADHSQSSQTQGSSREALIEEMNDGDISEDKSPDNDVLSNATTSVQNENATHSTQAYDVNNTNRSQNTDKTANKSYIQEVLSSSNVNSSNGSLFQSDGLEEKSTNHNMGNGLDNNTSNTIDNDLRDIREIDAIAPCEPYKKYRTIESKDDASQRKIADAVADLGGFGKKRFIGRWSVGMVYAPDWHFRTMGVKSPDGEALLNQRKTHRDFCKCLYNRI